MDNTVSNNINKRGYSVDEAAEYTSLSKPYLRKAIYLGDLAVKRFGRRVVITADELDRFLNEGVESK